MASTCKLVRIFCWMRQITIAAFVIEWYGNEWPCILWFSHACFPLFNDFACFGCFACYSRFVLVVSLVLVISVGSFQWLSSFRLLFWACRNVLRHLMIFDVICPCLKPLPLSAFGSHLRGSQWGNNCICLRGSNFRIFIGFLILVSYSLLFLPICLALFLSVPFFFLVSPA